MQLRKFFAAKNDWLIFGGLLIIFAALKIAFLAPHFADGWVYFYFGKLLSLHQLPYKDFFYSSPPLIPYFMWFWYSFFGFNLSLANFLPVLFSLVDAFLIFLLIRKKSRNIALLITFAYLFSFLNFATTDYFSEAHPLTTLVLLALSFMENKKFFLAGLFFGLAGLTKLYGILPAVFLIPFIFDKQKRSLSKFLMGIIASFVFINWVFYLNLGRHYLDLTFFNHLHKTAGIAKSSIFKFFISRDFLLLLVLPFSILRGNFRKIARVSVVLGTLVVFFAVFKDIYYLYLKVFLAVFVVFLGFLIKQKTIVFPKKKTFTVALVLILTNSVLAITSYITNQTDKARIENLSAIVAEAQKFDRPIFGDFEITPLVALLSGRNIFHNYVDTNSKWTDLGVFSPEKVAAEVHAASGVTVLTKNFVDQNIHGLEKLLPEKYFSENCQLQKSFPITNDYEDNAILVWSCS
ncbi:MAG: glycosyltransferase family 39 protein [Patescibacteria group bacterium]